MTCPTPCERAQQGKSCDCNREASRAAILGLWPLVRDFIRDRTVEDWIAFALLAVAVLGSWWGGKL